MRALFVSNYYPPHERGGYELWCCEVAAALAARGHEIEVITAAAAAAPPNAGVAVHRVLQLEVTGALRSTLWRVLRGAALAAENRRALRRVVKRLRPDVALLWGMWNVPRAVPAQLEDLLPGRVVYFLADYWPLLPGAAAQQLEAPARRPFLGLAKRGVAAALGAARRGAPLPPLRLEQSICVSRALRDELAAAGVPVAAARLITGGVPLPEAAPTARPTGGPFRLVAAGRIAPEKGLHTLIEALGAVDRAVALDVFGCGEAAYTAQLRDLARRLGVSERVSWRGHIARAELAARLPMYDAFVFPSQWQEPFGRSLVEAMAAGLPVIGTATGGAAEILLHGETGLVFPAGDAAALAARIEELRAAPELRRRLADAARRLVRERHSLSGMVDSLEAALGEIARAAPARRE